MRVFNEWAFSFLGVLLPGSTSLLCRDKDDDGVFEGMDDLPYDPADTYDRDGDGIGENREFVLGTDPNNNDSDGDGLTDGYEILVAGTDPNLQDLVTIGPLRPAAGEGDLNGDQPLDISDLILLRKELMNE
jgi:hypothetical protein